MPRTLHRLNEKFVKALAAPGYHPDGGGLYLQVSKSGTKSWIFRFGLNGRSRDMGLGSAALVSLNEARVKAAEARALVARKKDPIEEARALAVPVTAAPALAPPEASGPNFREFAEQYVDQHADDWRNAKHAYQWRATLRHYAYPVLGDLPLDRIETADVLRALEPIWSTKSETASRLRGRIERILAAAAVRGLRPATNPAAWRGHLAEALPKRRRSTPYAALPWQEVPAFLKALRNRQAVSALALEFAILTAARSGEARGARWSEIDLDAKTWTVPGDRMKAGRDHIVPLSDAALAVLERARPLRDLNRGLIFPGAKEGKTLSDMTLTALIRGMGYQATAHGFRASFKTWAEEASDHANPVIEAALAHIIGDKAERVYMRGDRLDKRRALMADWARYCSATGGTTIVPLRAASA